MHPPMPLCALHKSSIDIEPLSSILYGVNTHFAHHLPSVENYLISHMLETGQPKKKTKNKKKLNLSYIFLHLLHIFKAKIQNTHHYRNLQTFLISGQLALNGPANGPSVVYSKYKKG